MKPTLVVLAAGIGSRYGSLKQMDRVGPSGETIMDYSVYDALRAGFGKVLFVIRRDIEADFRETVIRRMSGRAPLDCVFQELEDLPPGFRLPPGRVKPWGTSHAVLAAAAKVREPFAVINADDFYGRSAFESLGRFLAAQPSEGTDYALVGYGLGRTLSEHGSVARGVCEVDARGLLTGIVERTKIERRGAEILAHEADGRILSLAETTIVSMNFWGFTPTFFEFVGREFTSFLRARIGDPKAEMFIPLAVEALLRSREARVRVLPGGEQWFGVTYKEDKPRVQAEIRRLVDAGAYPESLW